MNFFKDQNIPNMKNTSISIFNTNFLKRKRKKV